MTWELRQPIDFENSTVLGQISEYLWGQLYGWGKAWVDGHPCDPQVFGHGEYLHVPAGDSEDFDDPEMWYRVRCRLSPGNTLKIGKAKRRSEPFVVESVRVHRDEDDRLWWVIGLNNASTPCPQQIVGEDVNSGSK